MSALALSPSALVTGALVALGVWLTASIPFALYAGHVLRQISDDYPPIGEDDTRD